MAARIGEMLLEDGCATQAPDRRSRGAPEVRRRQAGVSTRPARLRPPRPDRVGAQSTVRRSLHRPRPVRPRGRGRRAAAARDRPEIRDRAGEPKRPRPHDRDDRPDQRLRGRRHRVHDRMPGGAGGGDAGRRRRGRRALLRRGPGPERRAGPRREPARPCRQGARGDSGGRRRPRSGRGDGGGRRHRPRVAERGDAGRPARQRRARVRDSEGRERRPLRALRETVSDPVPDRRFPVRDHGASAEVPGRHHLAPEGDGEARHRRETASPGRPHQAAAECRRGREGDRLPRLLPADPARREDRAAAPRPRQADARHDPAGAGGRVVEPLRGGGSPALGARARDRTDRQRQDQHAVLGHLPAQHAGDEHHDGRGSGRVQLRRGQPGADAREPPASPSPSRCARSCGRTPTSSSSARSAISRRRRLRSRRP